MLKLITYYRSNVLTELSFLGKEKKLSASDISSIVNEALVEPDDDNDNADDNNNSEKV